MAPSRAKSYSWDPVLLISQIVSMQTLHYLTLSIIIPPLLYLFSNSRSLMYDGGPLYVGMVMDWREMAGQRTFDDRDGNLLANAYLGAWSGGQKIGNGWIEENFESVIDVRRGWIIAICWMIACGADICWIYTLVRRPRLVLDFALTLVFNHLVLTTYYSASVPTSLFFWIVVLAGSAATVIVAEQLCVKRELSEGLAVISVQDAEDMEMGSVFRRD